MEQYFLILGINKSDSLEKIKTAYYKAAKKQHPDLYPNNKQEIQQLKMMKINEAYMAVLQYKESGEKDSNEIPRKESPVVRQKPKEKPVKSKDVAFHKNADYVYYKRGFEFYKLGQKNFFNRKDEKGKYQFYIGNREMLKLAISSLRYFQKSYQYFYQIVKNHPDSIWLKDSKFRLWRLDQYNRVYYRICKSLSAQIEGAKRVW